MELSGTTFILEILNFLVLVWILKRFLYKPVLDVIARRKAGIDKQVEDAKAVQTEAETLRKQYEGRLAQWEKERQRSRRSLAEELEAKRNARLAELRSELDREREKARVAEERRQADSLRNLEKSALLQGALFATRLLERAAGAETHQCLVELLIDELKGLSPERIASLRNNLGLEPISPEVVSAFPLDEASRKGLREALASLVPADVSIHYEQDGDLIAGLQVTIGAWVLAANLRDELRGFGDLAHVE